MIKRGWLRPKLYLIITWSSMLYQVHDHTISLYYKSMVSVKLISKFNKKHITTTKLYSLYTCLSVEKNNKVLIMFFLISGEFYCFSTSGNPKQPTTRIGYNFLFYKHNELYFAISWGVRHDQLLTP